MTTVDEARQRIAELCLGAWQLSIVAAAAESGLLAALDKARTARELAEITRIDLAIVEPLLDVLRVMGLVTRAGRVWSLADASLEGFLGGATIVHDLRATLGQSRQMVDAARRGTLRGGTLTDPDAQQGLARTGGAAIEVAVRELIARVDGLADRLSHAGAFLDVSAGVAATCVDLCRAYPSLRCVGIEPQDAPIAEAKKNILAAGLSARIELRKINVQDLRDKDAFDLAWIPQPFFARDVFASALGTVHDALKPGAWALTIVADDQAPEPAASLMRLRCALWGGGTMTPTEAIAWMGEAGYVDVRAVRGASGASLLPIVGRRREK